MLRPLVLQCALTTTPFVAIRGVSVCVVVVVVVAAV